MFLTGLLTGAVTAAIITFLGNLHLKRVELRAKRAGERFDELEQTYIPIRIRIGKAIRNCDMVAYYCRRISEEEERQADQVRIVEIVGAYRRFLEEANEALRMELAGLDDEIDMLEIKGDNQASTLYMLCGHIHRRARLTEVGVNLNAIPNREGFAEPSYDDIVKEVGELPDLTKRLDDEWSKIREKAEKEREGGGGLLRRSRHSRVAVKQQPENKSN